MELYQLEYFLEAARQRNFTRAASHLHLAQAALSEQIRKLEVELGTPLFNRGRRETVLTAAGETLRSHAEALLDRAAAAKRAVHDLISLRVGRLAIGAISSVSACLLPASIAAFRKRHPMLDEPRSVKKQIPISSWGMLISKALAKVADPSTTYVWKSHVCDMAGVNNAAGKEWKLVSLAGKEITAEKPPTMKFAGGGLSIFGGINRLTGSYALVGDSVTMGEIISTRMAGPPELMELEKEFASALKSVNGFHVHGDELELLGKDKVLATLRAVE